MDRKKYLTKFTPEDERIVDLFIEEMNKIHNLYLKAISSNDLSKANKLLKQLKNISNTLKSEYGKRAEKRIPEEYLKGSKYINDIAGIEDGFSLGLPQSREQIEALLNEAGPIHVEAVQALLNSSLNYVRSSLDGMERQAISLVNEFQQEKIREELAKGMISGEGIHKMNQRIEKYFQSEKLTGFRDKAGRFWSMERYIDMLTRTETAIANIQGTINRGIQIGITKFKIYEHPDCCEECAELDGNIVDISEGVVELPPFHPNCRGYISAVIKDSEGNEVELDLGENQNQENQDDRAKTPEERIKKALDIIENSTMYLGHEQAAIIDMNGNILRMASGKSGSVVLPRRLIDKPYIFTHNHPNSSSFSKADLDNRLNFTNEYGLRASSKVGTYSLYSESTRSKVLFLEDYKIFQKQASVLSHTDMKNLGAVDWRSGTRNDYVKFKDGTVMYYSDDPYAFDKFTDDHIWRYYREAIEKAANATDGVTFEFIPSDGVQKDSSLNKMYLDKVEELDKLRRKKIKSYEEGESIKLNDLL